MTNLRLADGFPKPGQVNRLSAEQSPRPKKGGGLGPALGTPDYPEYKQYNPIPPVFDDEKLMGVFDGDGRL